MVDERQDAGLAPIVILAMPRSGSSMTAGIFQRHGVWFGDCRPGDRLNPKGYFENIAIKKALLRHFGALVNGEGECFQKPEFEAEVRQITGGQRWGFKVSALYRDAFIGFEPKFIGIRRDRVFQANQNVSMVDKKRLPEIIRRHETVINECPVIIHTDAVIAGDYSTLRDAFEYCGLEMNESIVSDFVEPSLWHYKTSPTTTT